LNIYDISPEVDPGHYEDIGYRRERINRKFLLFGT
jgi:hypothetical protein